MSWTQEEQIDHILNLAKQWGLEQEVERYAQDLFNSGEFDDIVQAYLVCSYMLSKNGLSN
jgi:hypothetical protein